MGVGTFVTVAQTIPLMLALLAGPAFIAWRRTRSLPYTLCFVVFGVYLLAVVEVAILPLEIGGEYSDFMRQNASWAQNINLIPFYFGPFNPTLADVWETMALNVLLTLPFGFGVSFVARVRPKAILWIAPAVGLFIETSQLVISLLLGYPYRIIDINDVLMNALGVWIGYGAFWAAARLYLWALRRLQVEPTGLAGYLCESTKVSEKKALAVRPSPPSPLP